MGERKPFTVVPSHADDEAAQFSPDGEWIAYQSNQSGRAEVYVQPFPGPGQRVQVSLDGATQARWRHDGKELFFVGLNEQMMAATMNADVKHGGIDVGTPKPLFPTHLASGINVTGGATGSFHQYAVAPDERFLLNTVVVAASSSPLTVILNWQAALAARERR